MFPGGKAAGHLSERLASLQRPCASAVTAFPEPMSIFPQQLPASTPCLQGCWPGRLPGSQVPLVLPGSWDHRTRRGGLYPTPAPHRVNYELRRACFGLHMDICLHYPGIAALFYRPLTPWALWFLGWPGPKLADHPTQQLPAF